MTSVFISYSTTDAETGQKLYNALLEQKRDVWMDWKSIALTADWWNEIKDGIETSDNFVFLISPNSIASPICHLEIQYAHSLNKRMIPVLITPIDERAAFADLLTRDLNELQRALLGKQDLIDLARDNWKLLSSIQWINLARDGFDAGLHQLSEAVDTDLDYIQEHTRLLLRAKDWSRRGKTPSLLLRGDDLIAAETWLITSETMKPPATGEHREFITESHRVESEEKQRTERMRRLIRRFRVASVGLGVLFTVTLVTIVIGTIRLTEISQQLAVREAGVASLRIATLANEELSAGDVETAALLGVRALSTGFTAQADEVLQRAADQLSTRLIANGWSVSYSPDGSRIVSLVGQTAYIWDTETGDIIHTLEGHTGTLYSAIYSPDGRTIFTSSSDGTARRWDANTGQFIGEVSSGSIANPAANRAVYSPDGRYLATILDEIRLLDATTGFRVSTLPFTLPQELRGQRIGFSPDSRFIAFGINAADVVIWDTQSESVTQTISGHSQPILSARFSPDGTRLLTTSYDDTARIWNLEANRVEYQLIGHTDNVIDAAWCADGTRIVTLSHDLTARLWDASTGQQIRTLAALRTVIGASLGNVECSPTGDEAAVSAYFDVKIVNVRDSSARRFVSPGESIVSAQISPDGRYLLTAAQPGSVRLWDIETAAVRQTFSTRSGYDNALFSPDGETILTVGMWNQPGVEIWSAETGEIRHSFEARTGIFSPNGQVIALTVPQANAAYFNAGTTELRHAISGELITTLRNDMFPSMQFSPDGTRLFTVTGSANAGTSRGYLIDTQSGQVIRTFDNLGFGVNTFAFSPDGRLIAAGADDRNIRLWNVETGELQSTLFGHTADVTSVDFSPDGRFLVSGSADNTVRIWDLSSMLTIRILDLHTNTVNAVRYSPDGRYIVTASSDGTARIWDAEYMNLIQYVCSRLSEDLNGTQRYLYGLDDSPTCPQFTQNTGT